MMHQALRERIAECDRLEAGQEAEGQGLRAASRFEVCLFPYSTDAYLQGRFAQGFREGKIILEIHKEVSHAFADHADGIAVADGGLRVGEPNDSAVRTEAPAQQPSPYSG